MTTTMNPSVINSCFSYKDLLLRKLYYPVTCSVLSQIIILQAYLFIANFNALHPVEWVTTTLATMTYPSTWLFLSCFLTVVFLQSIVCAKDYVITSSYRSNRFQKLVSVFSVHNFVLLLLHIQIGGALVWLFLSLEGGTYQNLISECKPDYCLNSGKLFLIIGGLWTGFYYFVRVYVVGRHLIFPVIYQRKLLQFKSSFASLLKESVSQSVWPMLYFITFYYLWGTQLKLKIFNVTKLHDDVTKGITFYFLLWLFGALYFLSMNLMRFFFNLFITEPVEFPLVKFNENILTLQEAILLENLPIVQNLASLDLVLLSQWAVHRRQALFTLSQPGGHPHNWNTLISNVLTLFNKYTEVLNKSTETIITTDKNIKHVTANTLQACSPTVLPQSPDRYRNFRNMSMYCNENSDFVSFSYDKPEQQLQLTPSWLGSVNEKLTGAISVLRTIFGINYLFGELPQVNIQKCLANGYVIIWTSEGISELAVCSLKEDKFGVVQKDLPALLTSLVYLKQSLEKVSKIPALSKRITGYDDFNYKMKNAVLSAVKRSLFNICLHFGEFIGDFPLPKDVSQYLQPYLVSNRLV